MNRYELVKQYFIDRPGKPIFPSESRRDLEKLWLEIDQTTFGDPGRYVRKLRQEKFLVRLESGAYLLADESNKNALEGFSNVEKISIMSRQNQQCASCGRDILGMESFIVLIDKNAEFTVENGQAICVVDYVIEQLVSKETRSDAVKLFTRELKRHSNCKHLANDVSRFFEGINACSDMGRN